MPKPLTAAFFCLIIYLSLSSASQAESECPDKIEVSGYDFAEALSRYGLTDDAEVEILRVGGEECHFAKLNLAIDCAENGDLQNSQRLLLSIFNETESGELKRKSLELLILLAFIDGDYCRASRFVEDGRVLCPDEFRGEFYDAIVLASEGDWAFSGVRRPRYRSPELARIMSFIVPGSGMLLTGKTDEGLRSAFVNGLFGWAFVDGISRGLYPRAIVLFYFFGSHYWLGGSEISGDFAERLNRNERTRAAREAVGDRLCCE